MADALTQLAADLGGRLRQRGLTLTTAESCTGGWIAKCITDTAGSSGYFGRGYITYCNAAKTQELGVSAQTLSRHGAVSEPVVREMARGALARSGADLAIAVSGIAGPGGGTPDKPVGTVCLAWALGERISVGTLHLTGDRETIRRQSVLHALRGALELLS
ncbi:nicotinamide-nucleotide amidohydrolase family protein [Thiohalocapsa marina]|uniref:Nicotinamide-nucleotide amidohydrolase family protein n=1 Tax=Thiohalocapsa marina TaxID=424902 RepID=A0A5M8FVV2_9GAMM|nr:nicotinamide-nucleotide amidohydrolase family protein [Thiohalocapsa marina]KAA6187893.1 nicotinamide-nucleotide amidohydrolase family protein [Thiohalocapsa marina]